MKEKISKNRAQILTIFIFGLFPLVCALVYTLKDGHTPFDVYLPASYWNDELMYYKQVENVVKEGLSKGWFGFNEAHGAVYPFAAWSPGDPGSLDSLGKTFWLESDSTHCEQYCI